MISNPQGKHKKLGLGQTISFGGKISVKVEIFGEGVSILRYINLWFKLNAYSNFLLIS